MFRLLAEMDFGSQINFEILDIESTKFQITLGRVKNHDKPIMVHYIWVIFFQETCAVLD